MNRTKRSQFLPPALAAAALLGLPLLLTAGTGRRAIISPDRAEEYRGEAAGCMVPPDPDDAAVSATATAPEPGASVDRRPAIDLRAPAETAVATFAMG